MRTLLLTFVLILFHLPVRRCRRSHGHHPHHSRRSALHPVSKFAPIGVDNFIGLANGTKDWTSPISACQKTRRPAL
jgi:hypothetical protein